MAFARPRVRSRGFVLLAALVVIWPMVFFAVANPGRVLAADPATHFLVTGFANPTTAGVQHSVTVTALDGSEATDTSYTGSVAITSSDGSAVLPTSAALTNGVGSFNVTLTTAGTQSIIATDTVTSSITGTQSG